MREQVCKQEIAFTVCRQQRERGRFGSDLQGLCSSLHHAPELSSDDRFSSWLAFESFLKDRCSR